MSSVSFARLYLKLASSSLWEKIQYREKTEDILLVLTISTMFLIPINSFGYKPDNVDIRNFIRSFEKNKIG